MKMNYIHYWCSYYYFLGVGVYHFDQMHVKFNIWKMILNVYYLNVWATDSIWMVLVRTKSKMLPTKSATEFKKRNCRNGLTFYSKCGTCMRIKSQAFLYYINGQFNVVCKLHAHRDSNRNCMMFLEIKTI